MAVAFGLIALAGCGYLLVALWRVRAFEAREPREGASIPISVFKPLRGLDPALFENLSSFCEQEYRDYAVFFCVRDADDPAVPVVRRVIEAHPDVDCTLVIDDAHIARNPKVANMMGALALARGELLVIADGDVRVKPTALAAVAAAFEDPRVGAASCVYRAQALERDLPSQLGALHVNDHFLPSVLVATAGHAPGFCLGALMAVRRRVFDEIGGFEAIGRFLGDDFALGALTAARGYAVRLIAHTVACVVHEPSLGAFFRHHVRWARTIRFQAPLGYAFSFVTYPLPFALACVVAAAAAPWSLGVLALTVLARAALHRAVRQTFDVPPASAPAIVLGDLLELIVWICSFFGSGVEWRGERFSAVQERAADSG